MAMSLKEAVPVPLGLLLLLLLLGSNVPVVMSRRCGAFVFFSFLLCFFRSTSRSCHSRYFGVLHVLRAQLLF